MFGIPSVCAQSLSACSLSLSLSLSLALSLSVVGEGGAYMCLLLCVLEGCPAVEYSGRTNYGPLC